MKPICQLALCAVLFTAATVVAEEPRPDAGVAQEPRESLRKRASDGTVYDGLQHYPQTHCGTGRSMREIETCWAKVLGIAEVEQTRVRQVVVAFLDSTERKGFLERDEEYQRVLKLDCDAQYQLFHEGTIRGSAYASCMVCGTRLRTRALEGLLDWTAMEGGKNRQEERVRWRALQLPACEE